MENLRVSFSLLYKYVKNKTQNGLRIIGKVTPLMSTALLKISNKQIILEKLYNFSA
jgi:hypothetical protein